MSNFICQRGALLRLLSKASAVELTEADLTDLIADLDDNIEEWKEELPL